MTTAPTNSAPTNTGLSHTASAKMPLFVACVPGLEPLLMKEVEALVGRGETPSTVAGGVELMGDEATLMRLNLGLGLASSVRLRLGQVKAKRFDAFVRKVARVPFERYLRLDQPWEVRATAKHSRLYHTGAIAQRVDAAIRLCLSRAAVSDEPGRAVDEKVAAASAAPQAHDADGAAGVASIESAETEEAAPRPAVVHARFIDDVCTLSLDTSGEPLHRRGYRLETARAPLREDLARALVIVSGWRGEHPLVDPLCGAGTPLIEAAILARGLPPGRDRRFAFMAWPGYDEALFLRTRAQLMEVARPGLPFALVGSDRDAGAIKAACANAERAGVAGDIRFEVSSLTDAPALWPVLSEDAALLSNLPFGKRVSQGRSLRALHQRLGQLLVDLPTLPKVGLLVADRKLAYLTGLDLHPGFHTKHGGLDVHAMVSG